MINWYSLLWAPILQAIWYGALLMLVVWFMEKIMDHMRAGMGERKKTPWRW